MKMVQSVSWAVLVTFALGVAAAPKASADDAKKKKAAKIGAFIGAGAALGGVGLLAAGMINAKKKSKNLQACVDDLRKNALPKLQGAGRAALEARLSELEKQKTKTITFRFRRAGNALKQCQDLQKTYANLSSPSAAPAGAAVPVPQK